MKNKLAKKIFLIGVFAFGASQAYSQNLVVNGDFAIGDDPGTSMVTGWNETINSAATFPFPILGSEDGLIMGAGTQILQTFNTTLQPDTVYTIDMRFVGYNNINPTGDHISGAIAYGTGSGGTSAFTGSIAPGDIVSGSAIYSRPI